MMHSAKKTELFESSHILESVVKLAFPTVIGQIIMVIYNMADTFFISLTGSDAMISAVTVCMPAFMFLSAVSNLFGVGGSSVISRAIGRDDSARARNAASFSFWGCVITTLLYSALALLFLDPFIDLLGGADEAVHAGAREYMLYTVVLGGLATAMNGLLGHLVRSQGYAVHASLGVALGGVLNIALDPLFMFVILRPGEEIVGAALATALSNLAAAAYLGVVCWRKRRMLTLSFAPTRKALEGDIPRRVFATGLPACLMTLCENISYAVLDNLMSFYGIAMQAGIGVAKKVNMLAHCIVRGMSQGVLPLIAYNYAAKNYKRMRASIFLSAALSIAMAALCMLASLVFSNQLVGIFIKSGSASFDASVRFLRILCLGGPFSACAYAVISFFQATGKGVKSFVLAIMRKGVLDIPLMFALNRAYPVYGIVWATPIVDCVCCAAAVYLFAAFMKAHPASFQKEKKIAQTKEIIVGS